MPRYTPRQYGSPVPLPRALSGATDLQPGESIHRGQQVTSNDGKSVLRFQADGNVALYVNGRAVWSTRTSGSSAQELRMQSDGNLALYDAGGLALWASGTHGYPGAFAVLQDDGNFVIYSGTQSLWSSRAAAQHDATGRALGTEAEVLGVLSFL